MSPDYHVIRHTATDCLICKLEPIEVINTILNNTAYTMLVATLNFSAACDCNLQKIFFALSA